MTTDEIAAQLRQALSDLDWPPNGERMLLAILDERDRMKAALIDATNAVDVALQQVERPSFIPNWDWLREERRRARAALGSKANDA